MRFTMQLGAAMAFSAILATTPASSANTETLKVYGPGGPAPAVKELARKFTEVTGVDVEVTTGPTSGWLEQAKSDAHVVLSGSENMMLGFVAAFEGRIDPQTIEPLYLRPSTLLVRKGNPKGIRGLRDLAKPGMRILVTEGAGQVGMWEDAAGRTGDLSLLRAFRRNIVEFAANSGLARKTWVENPTIDAWLIWNHWQIASPDIADPVAVESELTIWRATDVALTKRGRETPAAGAFVEFLKSADGEAVFEKWGWRR